MSATTLINVASATTAELLAFFNANTGGNQVKKFADRKTAERRVQALVDEMAEEIGFGDKLEEDERMEPDSTDIQIMQLEAAVALGKKLAVTEPTGRMTLVQEAYPEDVLKDLRIVKSGGYSGDVCPNCKATQDITAGRVIVRAGHQHIVDEDYFMCHCCGNEWGIKDSKSAKVAHKVGPRPEMVASLKIDRRIVDLLTGEEYANACQVWKAGLVSSAQGDRLSAVLYGAFKKTGKRDAICKVNGHSFRLAYL